MLSDRYDIHTALTAVPFVSILSAGLYIAGSLFYETDLAKVEKVELYPET